MRHLLFLSFMAIAPAFLAQVRINEVCAANSMHLPHSGGRTSDWIEVVNSGHVPVNLKDHGISDDFSDGPEWLFPDTVLLPGAALVILAAGDEAVHSPLLSADLRIGGDEPVFLFLPDGSLGDQAPPAALPDNHSISRWPDGDGPWFHTSHATPGMPNHGQELALLPDQLMGLTASLPSGWLHAPLQVQLYAQAPGATIRFTTDGSRPRYDSPEWTGALPSMDELTGPLSLSWIPTSDSWQLPDSELPRAITLRWAAFADSVRTSPIVSRCYFPAQDHAIPDGFDLISVMAEPDDLFGERQGIYVFGDHAFGNYHQSGEKWERPAHFTWLHSSSTQEREVTLRIHGRSSRAYPQKTLRVMTDHSQSDPLSWPGEAPGDDHRRWLVRSPDRLFTRAMFTDDLVHSIARGLDLDLMPSSPAIVYINGEYWGIHTIRERLDAAWIAHTHGVEKDQVDIIGFDRSVEVIEGNDAAYRELLQWLDTHPPEAASSYTGLQEIIDMPSFMDYMIVQLYFANGDFPVNNVRLWRERKEGARWRFLFFDADAGFITADHSLLERFTETQGEDPVSRLMSFLLDNEEFKADFSLRFQRRLGEELSSDRILDMIDSWEDVYSPAMPDHIDRWHFPQGIHEWSQAVDALRTFAIQRPAHMRSMLDAELPDPFIVYPNPALTHTTLALLDGEAWEAGVIELNDLNGRPVRTWHFTGAAPSFDLDLRDIPAGSYLVRASFGGYAYFKRLLIQ